MTKAATKIIWESPPEHAEGRKEYDYFYAELRENPGKWAIYPGTQSAASQWCSAHPEFEYISATTDQGKKVWMRQMVEVGE